MTDPRLDKLADVLVDYSLALTREDRFILRGDELAAPLLREVYRRAARRGTHTLVQWTMSGLEEIFLKETPEDRFGEPSYWAAREMGAATCILSVGAPSNTRALSRIPPARQALAQKGSLPVQEIFQRRWQAGELRWCYTAFPSQAGAQEAGMSLAEWEEFIFRAGRLDLPDPVAAWREQSALQERLCDFLRGCREIRLLAEDTDLTVSVESRQWINADGRVNFPDGEVFTGPVEDRTRGHVRFTYPAVYGGREVADVRLWFEEGRVVREEAASGEEFLREMLAMDEGARVLGEFAIGANAGITEFTGNTLFDEKIGGTAHMAVGRAIPGTGGLNQSTLHWDMVCDLRRGGEIHADGEVIQRNGEWLLDDVMRGA